MLQISEQHNDTRRGGVSDKQGKQNRQGEIVMVKSLLRGVDAAMTSA